MAEERRYAVKYVGEGVREVEGIGVFQNGTVVHLPAPEACKLAEDDEFVLLGSVNPASAVLLQIGQIDPKTTPSESPRELADWESELRDLEAE